MDEAVDDRSGARLSEKGNPKTVVEWPHKLMVIAVDGPAGAGKSTVARRLAAELGCLHVDSGAIYRSVTLRALYQSIDLQDRRRLEEAADSAVIEIIPDNGGGDSVVLLDGRDVTREIRSPAVGAAVSLVAMVPGVRAVVTEKLRSVASGRG
ncbi:MAG: (d)CMP kinase, partial [Firmicutes bacterium]|nr:(d)CMP kinase [Bacillota bacterium]